MLTNFAPVALATPPDAGQHPEMSRALKDLRKRRKLTLEQLAELADLSVGFLSRVERGERELGNKSRRRVAAILDVPESALQTDPDQAMQADHTINEPETGPTDNPPVEGRIKREDVEVAEAKLALITRIANLDTRQVALVSAYLDALLGETHQLNPPQRERA